MLSIRVKVESNSNKCEDEIEINWVQPYTVLNRNVIKYDLIYLLLGYIQFHV